MLENLTINKSLLPFLTAFLFVGTYFLVRWVFVKKFSRDSDKSLFHQLVLFSILTMGIITVILTIPFDDDSKTREHIIQLLGYIISGIIALSSATFIGNALAGVMLRAIRNFKVGDFLEVKGFKGRVSERGLFHTEIQTENSDLTTIPNLFLVTNPVNVTSAEGTFVSAVVSLGYDVPRQQIETALMKAAEKAALRYPFVIIESLGDYSVVYRVQGQLNKNNFLISSRSNLNAMVLDALHDSEIEIVSPMFMNQRQLGETQFMPKRPAPTSTYSHSSKIDKLIFDVARRKENIETKKENLQRVKDECEEYKEKLKNASEEEKEGIQTKLNRWEKMLNLYEEKIQNSESKKL